MASALSPIVEHRTSPLAAGRGLTAAVAAMTIIMTIGASIPSGTERLRLD